MGSDLRRVIVIDVEATCWETKEEQGLRPNELIEIGACELIRKTGEITNLASIAIKPQFTEVSPFCTQLTGWDQATLDAEGFTVKEAFEQFNEMFKPTEYTVWASYGDYDRQMLSSKTSRGVDMYKIGPSDNPFDRMRSHINVKTLLGLRLGLDREIGLGKALDRLKLKFEGRPHNGGDDAYNIARVLGKIFS